MTSRDLLLVVVACLALGATDESAPNPRSFGTAISLRETTSLAQVMAAPERYEDQAVLLRGRLTDLCRNKGCWTVLEDDGVAVRVRFRDYGFFLPSEALGKTAWVEGVAEVRTLSEQDAKHLAAESRRENPARVVGPQREVAIIASGVRLIDTD